MCYVSIFYFVLFVFLIFNFLVFFLFHHHSLSLWLTSWPSSGWPCLPLPLFRSYSYSTWSKPATPSTSLLKRPPALISTAGFAWMPGSMVRCSCNDWPHVRMMRMLIHPWQKWMSCCGLNANEDIVLGNHVLIRLWVFLCYVEAASKTLLQFMMAIDNYSLLIVRSAPLECNAGQVVWNDLGVYLQNQWSKSINPMFHFMSFGALHGIFTPQSACRGQSKILSYPIKVQMREWGPLCDATTHSDWYECRNSYETNLCLSCSFTSPTIYTLQHLLVLGLLSWHWWASTLEICMIHGQIRCLMDAFS